MDALASTLNAGSATTARYEWDFGDGTAAFDELVGFNAAHIYDRAGTYTVTLRVINENGKAAQTSTTVTIAADTRAAIYVSSAGNDANNGTSPTRQSRRGNAPSRCSADAATWKILFRRGDTFTTGSTSMEIVGESVLVGAYGSGANPTILYTGPRAIGRGFIAASSTSFGATVENLTFDSIYSGDADANGMPVVLSVGGRAATLRNSTLLNVNYGLNVGPDASGVLVQNNVSPSETALRGYLVWNEGDHVVLLGNKIANSTREHVFRNSGGSHVLIAGNDFANLDLRPGDPNDYSKSTINLQHGAYFYVTGNTLNGNAETGPLGLAGLDPTLRTEYVVIEANHVTGGQVLIKPGSEHVTIRNNILDVDNSQLISVQGFDTAKSRGVVDLKILNNTGINDDPLGNFLLIAAPVEGVTLLNNLYVSPNLTTGGYGSAPVYVNGADLSSFATIDANNWSLPVASSWAQGGFNWIGLVANVQASFFDAAEWNALSQVGTDLFVDVTLDAAYKPIGTADVINAGVATAGVITDYNGNYRTTTNWTIGAVQA